MFVKLSPSPLSLSLFQPLVFGLTKLFVTDHRMTNEAVFRADGTSGLYMNRLLEGRRQTEKADLSVSAHRTPTHSHAISRSLACLTGITRNAHGSQFEFRSVGG